MCMKRLLPFLLILSMVFVSCSQRVASDVGYISFDTSDSRGISAFIEYPSLLDRTWNLTAVKLDSNGTVGAGTYEEILMTDALGPFSVGRWRFAITDSAGKITGTSEASVKPGNNTISVTVRSTETKGTLSVENCNFLLSKTGNVLYVDLYIDGERINTNWVTAQLTSEDGDYYVLPTITQNLSQGIHTIRLYYATDGGGQSSGTVSVRIVNGMTTHFSIGEHEGNMMLSISFDEVSPIVG